MPGVEGKAPSSEELKNVRQRALTKLQDLGPGAILAADIERLKSDDDYVSRFWKHVFDQPGEQSEEAVNCVLKAFKWRKEFGVDTLDESNINMDIVNKGYLFTHNRDKEGCKLMVLALAKYKGGDKMDEIKRVLVYYLERLEREEVNKKISWVFDCKGAGLKNMAMDLINFIIYCNEHCYPDVLNFIYIHEMPWLLNSAFQLVKKTLPAAGVAKLRDVTSKTFGNFVDDDNRLESWGGNDDWEFEFEPEVRKPKQQQTGFDTSDSISDDLEPVLRQRRQDPMSSPTSSYAGSEIMSRSSSVSQMSYMSHSSSFKNPSQPDLLQLSQDLVFNPNSFGELTARMQIGNVTGKVIGYKMKTTTPERYKVRPSSGHLRPGESVVMEVSVSRTNAQNTQMIVQDKFMLSALTISSQDLSAQSVHKILKHSKAETQYRLRCLLQSDQVAAVVHSPANGHAAGANSGGGDLAEVKKEAAKVTKKLNDINGKLENFENLLTFATYGGIALLVMNFLILIAFIFF